MKFAKLYKVFIRKQHPTIETIKFAAVAREPNKIDCVSKPDTFVYNIKAAWYTESYIEAKKMARRVLREQNCKPADLIVSGTHRTNYPWFSPSSHE